MHRVRIYIYRSFWKICKFLDVSDYMTRFHMFFQDISHLYDVFIWENKLIRDLGSRHQSWGKHAFAMLKKVSRIIAVLCFGSPPWLCHCGTACTWCANVGWFGHLCIEGHGRQSCFGSPCWNCWTGLSGHVGLCCKLGVHIPLLWWLCEPVKIFFL